MNEAQPIGPAVAAVVEQCVRPGDVPRALATLLQFGTGQRHGGQHDRVRGYIMATALFGRTPPADIAILERVTRTACGDYRDVLRGMAYPEVLQTLEQLGLPR